MVENKKNKILYGTMIAFSIYFNRLTNVSCLVSLIKPVIVSDDKLEWLWCLMLCKALSNAIPLPKGFQTSLEETQNRLNNRNDASNNFRRHFRSRSWATWTENVSEASKCKGNSNAWSLDFPSIARKKEESYGNWKYSTGNVPWEEAHIEQSPFWKENWNPG